MNKPKQLHKKQGRISADETVKFLDDFANVVHGVDQKTKLISMRVPANILESFKVKARLQDLKYQSVIVRLMRDWIRNNNFEGRR